MEVRFVQLEKAPASMVSTPSGRATVDSLLQLKKAYLPIDVTGLPSESSLSAAGVEDFPEETAVRLMQLRKAVSPIEVSAPARVMVVSALQSMKAEIPIEMTDSGISIEEMAAQFSKAPYPIVLTELPNETEFNLLHAAKVPF